VNPQEPPTEEIGSTAEGGLVAELERMTPQERAAHEKEVAAA
jgi:branched-chain amino acid transport system ATP-binding protein